MLVFGFYLFMIAWFIAPSRSLHHTLVYVFLLVPALIHLAVCAYQKVTLRQLFGSPIVIGLGIFLTYMLTTSLWSDNAEEPSTYAKRLLTTLLFIYGVYIICLYHTAHFWRSLILGLLLCTPWLAVNLIFFPEAAFLTERFKGANAGVHYLLTGALLGAFFVLGACYLLQRLDTQGVNRRNVLLFAALIGVFYGILLTEARSTVLAIAVTALYWCCADARVRRQWPIALLCGVVVTIMLAPYAELFIARGFSQRFEIWGQALQMAAQQPILGHGIDAEFVINISNGEELYDPHNIHIDVFFEGGLVGVLLWLVFLSTVARAGWLYRHTPVGQCILPLLIYSVSVKFFESLGILSRPTEFWHLVWLCTGMAVAESMRAHVLNTRSYEQNHAATLAQ